MLHSITIALALAALWPGAARAIQEPEAEESRPYRIPDHAAAKSRMERADEHVAAGRWREALQELQEVLEEHRGDLLSGERPRARGGQPSLQPVHPGAGPRARDVLLKLPPEARALYRERHGPEARAAFERARDGADRSALAEVARRWPLTDAARAAWWALGDLEMERGEEDKARSAWSRALASLLGEPELELARSGDWADAEKKIGELAESGERAGAQRRAAHVRTALQALEAGSAAAGPAPFADALHPFTIGPGLGLSPGAARLSGRDLEGWQSPVALPMHPFKRPDSLFPARSGDVLLVTTSLRLLALHAWSGALLWDSGEPEGWNFLMGKNRGYFFHGVDSNAAIVAPAAGGHVAVAALQIPVTFVQDFVYAGNIPVTKIIPDRRLFAFDLESGRPLWDHEPPAGWDGESGGFAQRMSVAGPPVLSGTRILAPFYRMQGRIDYHVGCFDLETGALLWSTALISGQRELNMFGRAEHEFCAPPLVVHDDRVIALTQLGTIAALDLFTGEILWETLYDQVPLPKSVHGGFTATPRDVKWSNAPPVLAEGVVVATPIDSETMIGVDLATGGLLWSLDHRKIESLFDRADIHLLVGARPGLVFVSGSVLGAITSRSGLRIAAPAGVRWTFTDDGLRDRMSWRPVLAGDRIVLPLRDQRIEVDVETGRSVASEPWDPPDSGGNLVVGPGEMSTVSSDSVSGWFDWDLLTQKARAALAANPEDPSLALTLGRLLADRGGTQWQRGEIEAARTHLDEAEAVLARALAAPPGAPGENPPDSSQSPAAEEMHRVLRSQARLRAGLADRSGALSALRRARPLARDPAMLRDTILEELALLRGPETEIAAARAEAIAALGRDCAELPIVCDTATSETVDPLPSALPRFLPVVGSIAKPDAVYCEMPVGLWVILDRVADAAALRDPRAELVALHEVLERHPDVELPGGPSGVLAAERIGAIVREGRRVGRTDGYEAFEARAEKLLEETLASGDPGGLQRVGLLYPHSRAADQAADHRLNRAYEEGDATAVARIVQEAVPPASADPGAPAFTLADADERTVRAWLRLSATLARGGNRDFSDELLRVLAESHPDLRSDLEGDGGRTLTELAAGLPRASDPDLAQGPAPGIGRFGALNRQSAVERIAGDWEILGRLLPAPGAPEAQTEVYAAARVPTRSPVGVAQGVALVTAIVGRPADGVDLELAFEGVPVSIPNLAKGSGAWSRRTALARDRILVSTSDGATAIDGRGQRAWSWRSDGIPSSQSTIACASGVAVVTVDRGGGRHALQAIDAHTGVPLWRTGLLAPDLVPAPLVSSRRVVLLPSNMHREGRVLDLFTGRETAAFTFDTPARGSAPEDAWIEGDRLIVPWFENSRDPDGNHVLAFDLATGSRVWRTAFGDDESRRTVAGGPERRADSRELVAVLQRPGRTWLLVRSLPQPGDRLGGNGGSATVTMVELSTRIGALSPLPNVRVGPGDSILGLPRPGRIALSSTLVFLLGHKEGSNEARLRAVDLERGELWTTALFPAYDEVFQSRIPGTPLPQPALSDTMVLVAYSLDPRQGEAARETGVECLDRATGRRLSYFPLSKPLGRCDFLKLYPLGPGLLVQGEDGLEVLR